MKKYMSLGELLYDYRKFNNISQADFAASLNVDIRTASRWEKDTTLIKPEKEEELVECTFIPYQVIRNLNAKVAIPTFYDFKLRKYSMADISNELPNADWLLAQMDKYTKRIRKIEIESDLDNIIKYMHFEYNTAKTISKDLIRESVKLLPELNLIIFDNSGYYSGHCVFVPINMDTYIKLRNRELVEGQLTFNDLVDYRNEPIPVFHLVDITADCNDNIYYIVGAMFRFFRDLPNKDYIYSSITDRHDTYLINDQLGTTLVWEAKEEQAALNLLAPLRFYDGNFNAFFGK